MNFNIKFLKTISVLYAEDDGHILENMVKIFNRVFDKVYFATNGEDGLNLFKEHQNEIDIVISDITMPVKNGLEMMSDILDIKYVPTILISAHTDSEFLLNSIRLNIDRYITKPIKTKELIYDIDKLVQKNREINHREKATKTLVLKSQEVNSEKHKLTEQVSDISRDLKFLETLVDTYISTIKTDKEAIIIDVSQKFCTLYGYTKEEVLGKKIMTLQCDTHSNEIQKHMLDAIYHKKTIDLIHKFKTKNGAIIEFNMIMTPQIGNDGYIESYTFYQDLIHI